MDYQKEEINDDSKFLSEDRIFLPPKMSSKALVHKVLLSLPRPIEADKILEGKAEIKILDFYYLGARRVTNTQTFKSGMK